MRFLIIFSFLLLLNCTIKAQVFYPAVNSDTLNKLDANNKKTGWWLDMRTNKLRITTKIDKAIFYGYSYYLNGITIIDGGFFQRCDEVSNGIKQDTITELDGTYFQYSKKGLECEYHYKNGMPLFTNHYHNDGTLFEVLDYREKYQGNPLSSLYLMYGDNGNLLSQAYSYWSDNKVKSIVLLNRDK